MLSSSSLVNWLLLTVSIFNATIMLWLAFTVLFTAERRAWGVWITGLSLTLGAVFFLVQTILLTSGLAYPDWQFASWWKLGLIPAHLLPYTWYGGMLWYGGYWERPHSDLRRRHRFWFWLSTGAMGVGLLLLLLVPSGATLRYEYPYDVVFEPQGPYYRPLLLGLGGGYGLYIVLCLWLSLDVVRRPGPSARMMGDLARRRARPWLIAASFVLLTVTLMIAWAIIWVLLQMIEGAILPAQLRTLFAQTRIGNVAARFILTVSLLITLATIMLGQAAVVYELFTGKILPRRGLNLHWRRLLLLSTFVSMSLAGLLVYNFPLVHGLLLMIVVLAFVGALLGNRSYAERERTIANLRPFIASQRLYDNLLSERTIAETDLRPAFDALCRDVLETTVAYLLPLGPLAAVVENPLVYPPGRPPPPTAGLPGRFASPESSPVPLVRTQHYGGAHWAIPLWSERGLIGVLLLGRKRGGGLYTQEEMEIARASSERLVDTQAGAELSRRLVALQRQKMVESQIIDQKTRRVLHDDVLPQLHTAMLALNRPDGSGEAVQLLSAAHRQISDLLRQLPPTAVEPVKRHGLLGALRRLVEREMARPFDHIQWEIDPAAEQKAVELSPLTAEVVYYAAREAVRNAAKHAGGQERPLTLTVSARDVGGFRLTITDDGSGLETAAAGEQPAEKSGAGQGLSLHSTLMAVVGGQLAIESEPSKFTRVILSLPAD